MTDPITPLSQAVEDVAQSNVSDASKQEGQETVPVAVPAVMSKASDTPDTEDHSSAGDISTPVPAEPEDATTTTTAVVAPVESPKLGDTDNETLFRRFVEVLDRDFNAFTGELKQLFEEAKKRL